MGLKITIEPTKRTRLVDGVECREWVGRDDSGIEVVALIHAIAPQSIDAATAARYSQVLKDLGEARAAPIDMRMVT